MAEELVDEKPLDEEPAELTDEDLDRIADTAIGALQDILKYFEVGEVTIDEYEGDEGELILDITGDDLAVLIGRHGKTLDALQFLVSAITVLPGHRGRRRLQEPSAREAGIDCPFFREPRS